jgi:hypothetical protein
VDEPTNHWICEGCGEHIEPPYDICYQCGTDRTGKPNPSFVREIDAAEEMEGRAQDTSATGGPQRRAIQYSLRGLMTSVFVLCGLLALGGYLGRLFWLIIVCGLITNLLGLLMGWVVTYGFGLPSDGSNPAERKSPP